MRASFRPLSKLSTALKQTSFTSTPATLLKPGNQTTISINPWHYSERIRFYVRQLSPAAIQAAHATRLNLRRTTTWPLARFAAKYPTNRKPTLYLIGKLSAHSISQGLLLAAGWCLRASERAVTICWNVSIGNIHSRTSRTVSLRALRSDVQQRSLNGQTFD